MRLSLLASPAPASEWRAGAAKRRPSPAPAAQPTDVVNLDASLVEVTTEGDSHWASVRFQGTIREDGREPAQFDEVWNLQKPVSGNAGWLLAGIQQVS